MANTLPVILKNNVVLNSKLETIYIYFRSKKIYIWLFIDKKCRQAGAGQISEGKKSFGKLFMLWFLKPMGIRCTSHKTIQVNVERAGKERMTVIKKCLDNPGWYLVIYINRSHLFSLPWALGAGEGTLSSNCPQYPQLPKAGRSLRNAGENIRPGPSPGPPAKTHNSRVVMIDQYDGPSSVHGRSAW